MKKEVNMTDNEIIKVFTICNGLTDKGCADCPLFRGLDDSCRANDPDLHIEREFLNYLTV